MYSLVCLLLFFDNLQKNDRSIMPPHFYFELFFWSHQWAYCNVYAYLSAIHFVFVPPVIFHLFLYSWASFLSFIHVPSNFPLRSSVPPAYSIAGDTRVPFTGNQLTHLTTSRRCVTRLIYTNIRKYCYCVLSKAFSSIANNSFSRERQVDNL